VDVGAFSSNGSVDLLGVFAGVITSRPIIADGEPSIGVSIEIPTLGAAFRGTANSGGRIPDHLGKMEDLTSTL